MEAKNRYEYIPDYAIPPGATLLETIEYYGISQKDLADRTGLSVQTISRIITGKEPITTETANRLELVLSIPAQFWNNFERNYRETLQRLEERRKFEALINWPREKKFPIPEMIRRRLIVKPGDNAEKIKMLLEFFGIASPENWELVYRNQAVRFRRSTVSKFSEGALAVWLREGERIAQRTECAPYDKIALRIAWHPSEL